MVSSLGAEQRTWDKRSTSAGHWVKRSNIFSGIGAKEKKKHEEKVVMLMMVFLILWESCLGIKALELALRILET